MEYYFNFVSKLLIALRVFHFLDFLVLLWEGLCDFLLKFGLSSRLIFILNCPSGVFDKKFTEISPLSRMFSKNASRGPGLVDGREGNRL